VSPDPIAFPVPGTDAPSRAIRLYVVAGAQAPTRGGQQGQAQRGVDIGAMAEPPAEEALNEGEPAAEAPASEAPAAA
jgi:small subunit ribosomal protein S2